MKEAGAAACIFVVDDDRDIRETLVEILVEHGCAAVGMANGRQALDALKRAEDQPRPCLILLDLMMPVMDGREFRERQLQSPELAGIPVVVISAYQDLADEVKTMRVAACLQKPLQLADILRAAKEFCACP